MRVLDTVAMNVLCAYCDKPLTKKQVYEAKRRNKNPSFYCSRRCANKAKHPRRWSFNVTGAKQHKYNSGTKFFILEDSPTCYSIFVTAQFTLSGLDHKLFAVAKHLSKAIEIVKRHAI